MQAHIVSTTLIRRYDEKLINDKCVAWKKHKILHKANHEEITESGGYVMPCQGLEFRLLQCGCLQFYVTFHRCTSSYVIFVVNLFWLFVKFKWKWLTTCKHIKHFMDRAFFFNTQYLVQKKKKVGIRNYRSFRFWPEPYPCTPCKCWKEVEPKKFFLLTLQHSCTNI